MMQEPKADKRTIGVSPSNEAILNALAESGHFQTDADAAKFAMAYAVDCEIGRGAAEGANTKWNVGTFDDTDRTIRAFIESVYPEEQNPYRQVEYLINEGLNLLKQKYDNGAVPDVADLVYSKTSS